MGFMVVLLLLCLPCVVHSFLGFEGGNSCESQLFIGFLLGQGLGDSDLFNFGSGNKNCPKNFIKLPGCSHCYHFGTSTLTWHEARIMCQQMGAHLVIVNSAKENNCIKTYLAERGTTDHWMGLNDILTEGTFVWDTKLKATKGTTFRDFATGEPSTSDCVAFDSDNNRNFQWDAEDCENDNLYVCERSKDVKFKCNSW